MPSPCRRLLFPTIVCVRNAADSTGLDLRTGSLTFIGSVIAAATMLIGIFYLVIARFFRKKSTSRQSSLGNPTSPRNPPILFDTHEEFIDEEQGPPLDHPIWYIHTVGLDQSAIDSIGAFNFKKGEGMIDDGADCSVCLTEFEDHETLRLLPKCSHAFHVACIDMWLRSHKNCPLCRAPVMNTAPADAEVDNTANSGPPNPTIDDDRVSDVEEGESSGGGEMVIVQNEDAAMKGLRRSVSMDAVSASEIYRAIGVAVNGCGRERMKKGKKLSLRSTSRIIGTSFKLYTSMKS